MKIEKIPNGMSEIEQRTWGIPELLNSSEWRELMQESKRSRAPSRDYTMLPKPGQDRTPCCALPFR